MFGQKTCLQCLTLCDIFVDFHPGMAVDRDVDTEVNSGMDEEREDVHGMADVSLPGNAAQR